MMMHANKHVTSLRLLPFINFLHLISGKNRNFVQTGFVPPFMNKSLICRIALTNSSRQAD